MVVNYFCPNCGDQKRIARLSWFCTGTIAAIVWRNVNKESGIRLNKHDVIQNESDIHSTWYSTKNVNAEKGLTAIADEALYSKLLASSPSSKR